MGRKAAEKGAIQVARLNKPGLHFVGGVDGLALQVLPTGGRTWVLRMMVGDKRRSMGLGGFPDVTLAQARDAARQARAKVKQGIDPIEEARASQSVLRAAQASAITFEECATTYIEAKECEWKNDKHGQQWRNTLETYAYPVIGSLYVRDVELAHVTAILEPIWRSKTVTASRLRGRIESVLNWATTHGYRKGENPARWRGHLENLFPAPNKIKDEEHYPAIPVAQTGEFMDDLRSHEGVGAKALEFTALTASRSGEVRGAIWSEIDVDAKLWTVPAERMKGKVMHRKPLSDAAVELLLSLPRVAGVELVFASPRGGLLSDMTLSKLMKRMAYQDKDGRICVPHGLRSTFRDWASEYTAYSSEVIESALAHGISDKTEAAYFRSELLEKRRRLMGEWAKYCALGQSNGEVVPINRATN
jgi:integrase